MISRKNWKPTVKNVWMPPSSSLMRSGPCPKGYESVVMFARRHGITNNRWLYQSMRDSLDPLPHLNDEYGTGRWFVHSEKGDRWLARRQTKEQANQEKARKLLIRQLKVLETIAAQMHAAGYLQSHAKCLEMIETFKHETGSENFLPPKTEGET
jgi:hypothetical protein